MKFYFFIKRAFDVLASVFALAVTSPVWIVAVIGIELSDPGRVFYRARRIGRGGREFRMLKFRSMKSPKTQSEKDESSFKADTKRIFPFGAFIRKTKIDELPQFLNVIFGSMSIVGPRPAAIDQAAVTRIGKYASANSVRPGLTGPAALYDYVYGDRVTDAAEYEKKVLPNRLELEAYYIRHMSVTYDLKIIFWTIICVAASVFGFKTEKIYSELVRAAESQE